MTILICPHCEAENEAREDLCAVCGRPLSVDAAPDQQESSAGEGGPGKDDIDRWLSQLPERSPADAEELTDEDESLPDWLQAVRAHTEKLTDEEADDLMAFLGELDSKDEEQLSRGDEDAEAQAQLAAELPDWVAALAPEENWPETEADESLSRRLAEAEEAEDEGLPSTGRLPDTRPLDASTELEGIPDRLAGERLPEWLLAEQKIDQPGTQEGESPKGIEDAELQKDEPATGKEQAEVGDDFEAVLREAFDDASEIDEPAESETVSIGDQLAEPDERPGQAEDLGESEPAPADEYAAALQGVLDLPDDDTSDENVDQWLDLLEGLPPESEPDQLDPMAEDSDLESAELPDWLLGMRPEQLGGQPVQADFGPPEESGPLAGLRGIVPAASISYLGSVDRSATRPQMNQRQRQQAALLRRLTMVDSEPESTSPRMVTLPMLSVRVILGLALLVVVLLGWLLPDMFNLLPWSLESEMPASAAQVREVISANAGRTTLVAFDYTPAMAGELDGVAAAILVDLAENDTPVLTVSQFAAGVQIAEGVTADIENLNDRGLGYLPGEATGLRALAGCLDERCNSLAGRELSQELQAALVDVGLIVVLSAERDSMISWIEQVGAQNDIPMVAGITQAMDPVVRPYLSSEQLSGLVQGGQDLLLYSGKAQDADGNMSEELVSLTLAQWLLIVVLVVGALYFGVLTPTASAVSKAARK